MATIRDNVVLIKNGGFSDAKLIPGSLVATRGQPVENSPKVKLSSDIVTVLVRSGRKKSKEVAEEFAKKAVNMYAPHGGKGGAPKELNFFFGLTLTTEDGTDFDVYLGQGSTGIRNNWWIGSPNLEGQTLSIGSHSWSLDGDSVENDTGINFKDFTKDIPEQYRGVAEFLGNTLLKELFSAVNVFTFNSN